MKSFTLSRIPKTYFGSGTLHKVLEILKEEKCTDCLLLTGGHSFLGSSHYAAFKNEFIKEPIRVVEARVANEPSPELVDEITLLARKEAVRMVIAVGGGSVLDTGKAVSAMIKTEGSVTDYLEGIGTKNHDGSKVPFIAVPTTSGTGSEATKNAVLSRVGENGFKKSLRHDHFVPDYAILDETLSVSCPPSITAASGMDALNQLLEGYLSVKANPMTDALALSGIGRVLGSLETLCQKSPENTALRGDMAYAAYLSGIVLANAGLGYVHGFAGVIGGMANIPHGVVCGKLNACVFELVARRILEDKTNQTEAYQKLIRLSGLVYPNQDEKGIKILIDRFYQMEENLKLPSLSHYGLNQDVIERAVFSTSRKECPVILDSLELAHSLKQKL